MERRLGKIISCEFGEGGYQDACIGISFTLGGDAWGVGDFWGDWAMERDKYTKWTEQERIQRLGEMVMRIAKLLFDAKKRRVSELKGTPVEVEFEGATLKSWRVLTEVV